jgi:monothiol glutaredoxin
MPRSILDEAHIHPAIGEKIANNHIATVREVQAAVFQHDVVVVGMAQNPHVKAARQAMAGSGIAFNYCEYGSYFGGWRRRNALKMWTGWPTFPMIFVKGVLIGGASELKKLIASDELTRLLARNDVPAAT